MLSSARDPLAFCNRTLPWSLVSPTLGNSDLSWAGHAPVSWSSQSEQSSEAAEHLLGMDWLDVDGRLIAGWPTGVKPGILAGDVERGLGSTRILGYQGNYKLPAPRPSCVLNGRLEWSIQRKTGQREREGALMQSFEYLGPVRPTVNLTTLGI